MIERIGKEFLTTNIESGEYSYIQEAGSRIELERAVGHRVSHFKVDLRFEKGNTVILIETKQHFKESDKKQLAEYLEEEKALHLNKNVICILANTSDDKIKVWKSSIEDRNMLKDEKILNSMEYYEKLFITIRQNDREKVLKNTYDLNELLHKKDIDEKLRSQFVGTILLYIRDVISKTNRTTIDDELLKELEKFWKLMSADSIRAGIKGVLDKLLDGSENKNKKVELLQKNVLNDQKVRKLSIESWIEILKRIINDIYKYIDADSSEGQDILNLFFIAFNKYTGKADKNQAFTPDHITEFMCRITDVDRSKIVLDATCGSGSFLVQAMVKELSDCRKNTLEKEAHKLMDIVKKEHIFGIEVEEKAYGLATTNMLIHSDGNSNIKFGNCFDSKDFIKKANPDIILMNPPYNAKPISIPDKYKENWGKAKDGKEDPTKGFVFIHFISDVIEEMNKLRERNGENKKTVKLAVLLPVAAAIGNNTILKKEKEALLKNNTLEAVFTLPDDVFYPGASVSACCMLFTLGKPHVNVDGTIPETFFGYFKDDGFKKKKNLGRVEQFDDMGNSIWKSIENKWVSLFRNKKCEDGLSATAVIQAEDEWLCEAYMKTDYNTLTESDFQQTVNDYLSYIVKTGKVYEY